MKSVILKSATRLVSGIVLVFAVYLLVRGHHAPGGGFIAALVTATGFALAVLAAGPRAVRKGLFISPRLLIGIGMALALGAGMVALAQTQPFLTGIWWPAQGAVAGTPLLFDVGVYLVVLGAILTVVLALEER